MKKRVFLKKKIGALTLALLVSPLAGVTTAQAASIYIEGGGGGGGGENSATEIGGGGGGAGGRINTTASTNAGGAGGGASGGADGRAGTGGNGGANPGSNFTPYTGGTGGAGSTIGSVPAHVTGGVAGTAGNAVTPAGGRGGNGGAASADTSDISVAGVGSGDSVYIRGGSGGNGGAGEDYLNNTGLLGGRGGNGGNASLTWNLGSGVTITNLEVLAGTNGSGVLGYTDNTDPLDPVLHSSSGGRGGAAALTSTGDLSVSNNVAVTARGNTASFTSNGNLNVNGTTTVTASTYAATMDVTGNAALVGNLSVLSNGSGPASFAATGNVTTTTGNVAVSANSSGAATFSSAQLHTAGDIAITSSASGDASMNVTGGGNSVSVANNKTMTITASNSGNASFTAANATNVRITGTTGTSLGVISTGTGRADFAAGNAVVEITNGKLVVNSTGSTNATGTAGFSSLGLSTGGTDVLSGAAAATATVTTNVSQVSAGALTVRAGAADAIFRADNTNQLNVNTVIVGDNATAAGHTGNASILARNATITAQNQSVTISTAGATGGTKGIYAKSLNTGVASGVVTMTGTGTGNSSAQLILSDTLRTPTLNLTGNGTAGSVVTNIANVDVATADTTFNFTNTVGSNDSGNSGVYFRNINLGTATSQRNLNATNAALGTFWADNLNVSVHNAPTVAQIWTGDLWLGGTPGVSGNVGALNMQLPAGIDLHNYLDNGSNPNYMLAVSGSVTVNNGAAVNMFAAPNTNPFAILNPGDQVQIVHAGTGAFINAPNVQIVSSVGATDYLFDLALNSSGDGLLARLIEGNDDVAKAYLEGNVAALGNLYQGAELISRTMRNTFGPDAKDNLFQDGNGIGVMFGAEYAHQRLNAGSHVSSDYYNMVVGPALRTETGIGRLGLAIFFETGHGDYSTHNAFTFSHVVGNGNTDYYGGGIALRNDFAYGIYTDLSLRAGSVSTDLSLRNRPGASYDETTTYMGGHANWGVIVDVAKNSKVDLYGGVWWTRLNGFNTTTDIGERVEFDAVDSVRSQLGGRYHYTFNESIAGYAGAAWEYEFSADVGGTMNSVRINEPSLSGSTAKGEAGVSINPAKNFTIDLGMQGYSGKREGVGGTATLTFTF